MKVKINNTVYDSEEIPIVVQFSEDDKTNIFALISSNPKWHKYLTYPNWMDLEDEMVDKLLEF
jgi:hypothetical protein